MAEGTFTLPPGPVVMGVLNLSNKSIDAALAEAEQMLSEGAAIIDLVFGQTLFGGVRVYSIQQELAGLIPVIEAISQRIGIPISVGTSAPEIMTAAVQAGAKIINDARALTKLGAIGTVSKLKVVVCLMHMLSDPVNQITHQGPDIVSEVYIYLEQRINACVAEGIDRKKIIIDPGFGYGKNLAQNLNILRSLQVFKGLQCPILVDVSQKSMIGQILNANVEGRIYGGVAAEMLALGAGANIIRSHNVQASADAIKVLKEYLGGK